MTELTCIVCPKGCRLNVDEENGFLVTGYGCPRGKEYGHKELTAPTRTLTSIVRIEGAIHPCCPVKTSGEIPKRLIIQAMNLLKKVRLSAPVAAGAVVVQDICGTGQQGYDHIEHIILAGQGPVDVDSEPHERHNQKDHG